MVHHIVIGMPPLTVRPQRTAADKRVVSEREFSRLLAEGKALLSHSPFGTPLNRGLVRITPEEGKISALNSLDRFHCCPSLPTHHITASFRGTTALKSVWHQQTNSLRWPLKTSRNLLSPNPAIFLDACVCLLDSTVVLGQSRALSVASHETLVCSL